MTIIALIARSVWATGLGLVLIWLIAAHLPWSLHAVWVYCLVGPALALWCFTDLACCGPAGQVRQAAVTVVLFVAVAAAAGTELFA